MVNVSPAAQADHGARLAQPTQRPRLDNWTCVRRLCFNGPQQSRLMEKQPRRSPKAARGPF